MVSHQSHDHGCLAMIRMRCHEKAMIMDEKTRMSHDGQSGVAETSSSELSPIYRHKKVSNL